MCHLFIHVYTPEPNEEECATNSTLKSNGYGVGHTTCTAGAVGSSLERMWVGSCQCADRTDWSYPWWPRMYVFRTGLVYPTLHETAFGLRGLTSLMISEPNPFLCISPTVVGSRSGINIAICPSGKDDKILVGYILICSIFPFQMTMNWPRLSQLTTKFTVPLTTWSGP